MEDILPGEIYSCSIVFDKQPPTTYINLHQPNFDLIAQLLQGSSIAAWIISMVWNLSGEGKGKEDYFCPEELDWASSIASHLRVKLNSPNVNHYARKHLSWEYFSVIDKDIFVVKIGISLTSLSLVGKFRKTLTTLEGVEGQILDSSHIKNFIPYKTVKTASRIFKSFGQKLTDAVAVPIESHLFLLGDKTIVGIKAECGFEHYLEEKERLLQRHQVEAKTLLPYIKFKWGSQVDDEEFEKLILELLAREPGVLRARKIGKGNEPDFGRDILVEWYRPTYLSKDENPIKLQRIVVQCKAYSRTVNKSRVSDIMDLLYFHNATGYLLVALSAVTKPLIEFLERINQRDGYWTDWWTRVEIEDKLRANRDIAMRYSHLATIMNETIL